MYVTVIVLLNIIAFLLRPWMKIEIRGKQNILTHGSVIFAAKHSYYMDIPFVGIMVKQALHYMAKKELFNIPIFGWGIKKLGAFPVNREKPERSTIRTAVGYLSQNEPIIIYPEGTRTDNQNTISELFAGVAMIVLTAKFACTITPVGIAYKYRNPEKKGLPQKAAIVFGSPLEGLPKDREEIMSILKKRMTETQKEAVRLASL